MAKAQPVCRSFPREDDRAFRSCDSIPDYPIVSRRCLDEELCLDRLIVSPLLHSAGHLFDCLVRAFRPLKGRLMCNDYGNRIPYSAYLEAFSHLKIRLFTPGGAPNLEPRDDIWPTDVAPIIRANKDGAELIQLRWGFPPGRPKGPPVINMRSEKRRFPRGRCLVPVSHFYEFTGKRSPKDKWRFTKVGEDWFCIAGLWRPVEGDAAAFTMLTCEPGPDVAPIHNRQIVVLDRSEWAAWLNSQTAEEDLLKPSPPGSLKVEKVEGAPGKQLRSKVPAA